MRVGTCLTVVVATTPSVASKDDGVVIAEEGDMRRGYRPDPGVCNSRYGSPLTIRCRSRWWWGTTRRRSRREPPKRLGEVEEAVGAHVSGPDEALEARAQRHQR